MTDLPALLLAAHAVGDWVVQTDWQAATKVWPQTPIPSLRWEGDTVDAAVPLVVHGPAGELRRVRYVSVSAVRRRVWWRSWRAMAMHLAGYHLFVAAACHFAGLSVVRSVVLVAVSAVTHGMIDRRWTVRRLMAHTGSRAFSETTWGVIAVDQALHIAVLSALAALV